MTVKVHLFNKKYSNKPDRSEMAYISNNITGNIREIEIEELAQLVGENGHPFTPAIFNGSRRSENFISQQVYALDFDGGLTLQEFWNRAEQYTVLPAFVYETYSSTEINQRFRAVFINDIEIKNMKAASILTGLLLYLFPEADQCCKDSARMYLGGKRLLYFSKNEVINVKDVAVGMQAYIKSCHSNNYSRQVKKIGDSLGVCVCDGLLEIHRKEDLEIEENWIKSSIILEDIQNSSNCYLIALREMGAMHHGSLRKKTVKKIQGIECKDLISCCSLFKEFYYGEDIPHNYKFLLATNLVHIKGGRSLFFKCIKENVEKWKCDWDYIRKSNYHVQRCENGQCPYVIKCQCKTILDKLSRKIYKVGSDNQYIGLDEAGELLQKYLEAALSAYGNNIYLIKAQTALGKTTAYCKIAANPALTKKLMIVVPTNKLQEEVGCSLRSQGVEVELTTNLDSLLKGLGLYSLQDEVADLYRRGFAYRVKKTIKGYIRDKTNDIDEFQKKRLTQYLDEKNRMNGETCIVTTHAYFLTLDENILKRYEIIIDEDILMTIFRNTATIGFDDLKLLMKANIIPSCYECRIREIMNLPDGSIGKTGLYELNRVTLEELYEKQLLVESSISDFIASDSYHVDSNNSEIHFFKRKKLPNVKMIVVSASINKKLYSDFCRDRYILYEEIPMVKYTGKLKEYTAHSMSRNFIKQVGIECISKSVDSITKDPKINQITFKMMDKSASIYYGKTEGFNEYKGKNLCVLGTPHMVPFVYQLVGANLGYIVEEELTTRRIEYNGYSFKFMTYKNTDMRNLQFYFIESELEQAIGRARLLRFDCTVYLFSNFPCRQAEIIQDDYLQDDEK